MYVYGERAERASLEICAFLHNKSVISFNMDREEPTIYK